MAPRPSSRGAIGRRKTPVFRRAIAPWRPRSRRALIVSTRAYPAMARDTRSGSPSSTDSGSPLVLSRVHWVEPQRVAPGPPTVSCDTRSISGCDLTSRRERFDKNRRARGSGRYGRNAQEAGIPRRLGKRIISDPFLSSPSVPVREESAKRGHSVRCTATGSTEARVAVRRGLLAFPILRPAAGWDNR